MVQISVQIDGIFDDIRTFLPRMIQACESLSESLYTSMSDESWQLMGDVVEGIDDLYRTLNTILTESSESDDAWGPLQALIDSTISELSSTFQAMNQSLDEEDFVGAADYFKYEFIPLFQRLAEALGEKNSDWLSTSDLQTKNQKSKEVNDDSDQLFDRNLHFFQQRFPEIYDLVSVSSRDTSKYHIEYAKNGMPNLYINDEKPRCLYSKYNPENEVQRWGETIAAQVADKAYIILFGFGYGYHVQYLIDTHPDKKLYIYEPDEQILLAAMYVIDFEILFKQSNIDDFVVGRGKKQRNMLFYRFLKYMKREPGILSLPVYDRIKDSEKLEFFSDAQTAIMNYNSSNNTYDKFGLQWVKNSVYNLAPTLFTPSLTEMKNKLYGMTAVVVGAGPSLEADIEYLRQLKDHALIIAAGSTTQSLKHFGVDPHLIVSIDGGEANYNVFKDLDTRDIPFLFCPMIEHHIIENRFENLYHVHLTNDYATQHFFQITEEDAIFEPTQSVTGTAIQAAVYMGCTQIVFTGQDLSYPTESMYAQGAKHVDSKYVDSIMKKATMSVENVQGTFNRTTQGMKVTLDGIEDQLERFPHVRFVNTTKMGAKIKHTVWEPMESVLSKLEEKRLEPDFFKKVLKNAQTYDRQRIMDTISRVEDMPRQIALIEESLKRINRSLGKLALLSRTNQKKCFNEIAVIDRLWHSVVHSAAFNAIYLKVFRNDILSFERELADFSYEKNIIQRTKRIGETLGPLVTKLLNRTPEFVQMIEEAQKRIETRKLPV